MLRASERAPSDAGLSPPNLDFGLVALAEALGLCVVAGKTPGAFIRVLQDYLRCSRCSTSDCEPIASIELWFARPMTELVSHWSALHWTVLVLAVTVGALVQASVGFGFALIAAPFLMFVSHEFVPGPMLACSSVLSAGVALREWQHMDRRIVGWTLIGRIPGVWLGAFLVAIVSEHAMELLFGGSVLLGVAMSMSGLRVESTTPVLLGTGVVSGLMGTLSSIGGPPIALLSQHQEGPRLRATLCAYFTVGCVFSNVGLALVGRFGVHELIVSGLMLPPTAAGFALARYTRRFLDAGHTRKGVLAIALISGVAVIAKALMGLG